MSIEQINLSLFSMLNAPEQASAFMVHYAIFVANDALYLLLFFFGLLWLRGDVQAKLLILKALIFTSVTVAVSEAVSAVLHTPRPFVMDVGRTLIEHSPTGSFPSNHMAIFSSIGFAYYFSAQREAGKFLLILAWLVAWARIYVGVHFPIDMLGAFILALTINYAGLGLWNKYHAQLMAWVLTIYQKIFSPLIRKGLVK